MNMKPKGKSRIKNSSRWLDTDVLIKWGSLIANYSSQFDNQYQEGWMAQVMSALQKSVAEAK